MNQNKNCAQEIRQVKVPQLALPPTGPRLWLKPPNCRYIPDLGDQIPDFGDQNPGSQVSKSWIPGIKILNLRDQNHQIKNPAYQKIKSRGQKKSRISEIKIPRLKNPETREKILFFRASRFLKFRVRAFKIPISIPAISGYPSYWYFSIQPKMKIHILLVIVGNRRQKSQNDSFVNPRPDFSAPIF